MKGFGLLLMLAAVVIMLMHGPPAVSAAENHYCMNADAAGVTIDQMNITDEQTGVHPFEHWGVLDPGSCGRRPFQRVRARARRLLWFSARC